MINKIEVRSPAGTMLTLTLDDSSSGFVVMAVDGLDPVKATITSSSFAKIDGSQYQSCRRESRNIILKLGLEPDYISSTIRSLRNILYDFFMPKSEVSLRFYIDSDLVVNVDGRVESCDADLFSKDVQINISVLCFDPDFVDNEIETINGNTVSTETNTELDYTGTVDAGILFTMTVDRTITTFTIYHNPPDGTFKSLDFAMELYSGDSVTISTVRGDKYVYRTREGVTQSVLYAMSPQSNWIEFSRGINHFRVYTSGAAIPYTITYYNRYGGL